MDFFPGNPKNIGTVVEVKLLRWMDLKCVFLIFLTGRFELKRQQVVCTTCNFVDRNNEVKSIIANGLFPGNPKNIGTVVGVKLLMRWMDLIMANMSGTSLLFSWGRGCMEVVDQNCFDLRIIDLYFISPS